MSWFNKTDKRVINALPSPDDTRWTKEVKTTYGFGTEQCLTLGQVTIWVGASLAYVDGLKVIGSGKYAEQVIEQYKLRKAMESL